MGRARYPQASRLVITADSGGSNSSRNRLWKTELQRFADETGLTVMVRHLPPGTSKWNRIEHRLFSFITGNWRGQRLLNHHIIVELIAGTRTDSGLVVRCRLDPSDYPRGSSSATATSPPSTSAPTTSMASGTTRLLQDPQNRHNRNLMHLQ